LSAPAPVSAEARIVTDVAAWNALLIGPFREGADIYHHPDFVALEARRIGATPGLVVAEIAGRTVGLSLLFRPIPGHPELCDATSVYGYNGLLYSGPTGESAPSEALAAIERALYLRGCVAVFNRSHPLRPAQLPGRELTGETLLLDLAAGSLVDVAGRSESIVPKVAFRPDGTVVPKVTKCSSLPPGTVLVFGSGEPFNAASVPARAKRLNLTQQRRQRDLGPLVRAPQTPRQLCRASPGIPPRLAEPLAEPIHDAPWKFSPSGRWESPLALRPDRL
jgi:hypothetical protein